MSTLLLLVLVTTQPQAEYMGTYRVTAYCPCKVCCQRWARYHRTATGQPARGAIVAVDPRVVKMHSVVFIQGVGHRRCEDRGASIKGRRMDILLPSHREAKRFGVRRLRVWRIR